jgi:diacylglycerol kinase (ATP)
MRQVRVLINLKSGLPWSFSSFREAFDTAWEGPETDLTYQFSQSKEDSVAKTARAVKDGVETLLVVGGDGTVNSIGQCLIGTKVAMGVIPVGSGNGFARHFGIPLSIPKAVTALSTARIEEIDVGYVAGKPFLVTSSLAWDASIVRSFDRLPVRGIVPYFLAAVHEYIGYTPQALIVHLDTGETLSIPDPVVFTLANMTQFGGGAKIAPHASSNDGQLELVALRSKDVTSVMGELGRLYDGSLREMKHVIFRSFSSMTIIRELPAQIQVDGELIDAPAKIEVSIKPRALNVLVPLDTED